MPTPQEEMQTAIATACNLIRTEIMGEESDMPYGEDLLVDAAGYLAILAASPQGETLTTSAAIRVSARIKTILFGWVD